MFEEPMEFDMLRQTAAQVASEYGPEYWRERDAAGSFGKDFWDEMAEAGLQGLLVDEKYGGAGMGMAEMYVVLETLAEWSAKELNPSRTTEKALEIARLCWNDAVVTFFSVQVFKSYADHSPPAGVGSSIRLRVLSASRNDRRSRDQPKEHRKLVLV